MIIHPGRETTYAALFRLLSTMQLPTELKFRLTGRKLLSWDAVSTGSQPAMFLRACPQDSKADIVGINKWLWRSQVWIYYQADVTMNQDTYESKNVFTYLDAIEAILDKGNMPQDLGLHGIEHVWIDGQVLFWEGSPDQKEKQAVIVVPLSISLGT